MDGKPHSLLHSLSTSSSSGSLPIRAPITVDDSNFDNVSHYGSDSGFESEGFMSVEEFETASERPFVVDPDDEMFSDDSLDEGDGSKGVPVYAPVVDNLKLERVLSMPIAQLSRDESEDEEVVSEVEDIGLFGAVRVSGVEVDGGTRIKVLDVEGEDEDELLLVVNPNKPVVDLNGDEGLVSGAIDAVGNGILGYNDKVFVAEDSGKNSVSAPLVEDTFQSGMGEVKVESFVLQPNLERNADVEFSGEETEIFKKAEKERIQSNGQEAEEQGSVKSGDTDVSANGTHLLCSVIEELVHCKNIDPDEASPDEGTAAVIDEINLANLIGLDENAVEDVGERKDSQFEEREVLERTGDMSIGSDNSLVPVKPNPKGLNADSCEVEKNVNNGTEVPMYCENNVDSSLDVISSVTIDQGSYGRKIERIIGPKVEVELHNPIASLRIDSLDITEGKGIERVSSPQISESNPSQEITHLGNVELQKDGSCYDSISPESAAKNSILDHEMKLEASDKTKHDDDDGIKREEGSLSDEGSTFGNSEANGEIVNEMNQELTYSFSAEDSLGHSQIADGQIVTDSDEEEGTDGDGGGKELFDTAVLAALLKEAGSAVSDGNMFSITSADGSRVISLDHPAGLGSSLNPLRPAPRMNLFTRPNPIASEAVEDNLSEEEKKKVEKVQLIRVKFLRLVQRLGLSTEDPIVAQVLYRLVLDAGRRSNQVFSLESAKTMAKQLEVEGKDDLGFSLNILVIGKTGVGKSATINSIFGEDKVMIDAFEPATTVAKEIVGTVDGVKIRVIDTPGLRTSVMEQAVNRKILASIEKFMKKFPPDVTLYVDRLDTHTRHLNDLSLLKSITTSLGSTIWRNAIITLTHATSPPPDGPSGSPLTYEVFVAQRSHVVQQSISQVVGNLRFMSSSSMQPVSLVENHLLCQKNTDGQRVLLNGQTWRPQLLLMCYSMKILSEANSISKPESSFNNQKLFGLRSRSAPLAYLLSSLLQSHAHPKLSADQGDVGVDSDIELGDSSDSDNDVEDEYDQLPPFKPLRRSQIAKLSKDQRKAYFEEYDYRVKLLQRKQWGEEVRRLRAIKKKGIDIGNANGYTEEEGVGEDESPAAVPVPLPDMVLPPSFDGDNPAHRYRFLEPTSQLLARPVMDTHGWDHDCGYDGVSLERNIAIAGKFPSAIAVQITKDKKDFNIHLDSSVSAKHGENGSTMAGFDIQTIGRQLAYILRGETKVKNLKMNRTAAGVSITFLGENVATGLKIEDQVALGKCLVLVGSTGAVRSQGDTAYGANLEVRLKEKDFPVGQDQSSLSLSLMKWRGDLALMANLQSQISIGRNSKMAIRVGLNNKRSGQITVKISSSEQLQIALLGILPIALSIFRSIYPVHGAKASLY